MTTPEIAARAKRWLARAENGFIRMAPYEAAERAQPIIRDLLAALEAQQGRTCGACKHYGCGTCDLLTSHKPWATTEVCVDADFSCAGHEPREVSR